jgi:hypothetical protein
MASAISFTGGSGCYDNNCRSARFSDLSGLTKALCLILLVSES